MGRYELHTGRRVVTVRNASSAHDALFDYVRGLGCPDAEIMRLGPDALSWRGAVFRAVRVEPAALSSHASVLV